MKKKWGRNVVVGSIVSCLFVLTACGSSGNSGANGSSTPASSQTAGTKNIQSRVMKAGIVSPKGHPQALGLDKFAEIVEKNSGGKMKIQKFNDGTLGDDKKNDGGVAGRSARNSRNHHAAGIRNDQRIWHIRFPVSLQE